VVACALLTSPSAPFLISARCSGDRQQIGRTARGGKSGVAISLVTIPDAERFEAVRQAMQEQTAAAAGGEGDETPALRPFKFKMDDVNSFRYRVEDALASVTKSAIREARLKEIKAEIMISEKLKVRAVARSVVCGDLH